MKVRNIAFVLAFMASSFTVMAADSDPRRMGPNTTLSFDAKQAILTQDSKDKLKALIKDAKSKGQITEVQVAVWSDNPSPRAGEELSKPDRDLASQRARAVTQYLKLRSKVDVDTYNMAERASWLARTFDTTDADLKSEIGKGGDAPMSKEEFQIFRSNGQPSKAVVLVIMKHGG